MNPKKNLPLAKKYEWAKLFLRAVYLFESVSSNSPENQSNAKEESQYEARVKDREGDGEREEDKIGWTFRPNSIPFASLY